MVQSSVNAPRRRLFVLITSGTVLLAIGGVWRLMTTNAVAQWQAARLSDDALASRAGEANASFPFVFEWAKRLEAGARVSEAERVYARAMQMAPANADTWIGFGRTAFAARDWGKSSAALAKAVEQWPDNAQARFTYAAVLASIYRVHPAIVQLKAGLKLDPSRGEAFQTLGELEMRSGDGAAAADAYAHALALNPNTKRLKSHSGAALILAGKYGQAIPLLEAALKEDPSDINARFDLGKALASDGKVGDRAHAMQELNRVVIFSQNKGRAYVEAGRIWLAEGDPGNAIRNLEHAYELNPYNVDLLKLLVQTLQDNGRQGEAQRMRKSLDLAQTLSDARKDILLHLDAGQDIVGNLIRLARADRNLHDSIEARSALDAASAFAPGNPDVAREYDNFGKQVKTKE